MRQTMVVLCSVMALSAALLAQATQQSGQQQSGQQQAGAAQAQQGRGRQAGPPSMGGGQCSANPYNCPDAPNPLPKADTVWLEEMTWMDVRDAMKAGKTTVIISTGGMEPNGPWLALGKHNYARARIATPSRASLATRSARRSCPSCPRAGMSRRVVT